MNKSGLFTTLLTIGIGLASLTPLAASAAPPCPECFYPYRACMRAATTPEEQQACEDEYTECLQIFCPDPFATGVLTDRDRSREPVLASKVTPRELVTGQ